MVFPTFAYLETGFRGGTLSVGKRLVLLSVQSMAEADSSRFKVGEIFLSVAIFTFGTSNRAMF